MIKFARARSLKRNNGSLFSRLSRAEKYLTVGISRRDVDTASHVGFSLLLRRGAEDKSIRAHFVYGRSCLGVRGKAHSWKKEGSAKMKYTSVIVTVLARRKEGNDRPRNHSERRSSKTISRDTAGASLSHKAVTAIKPL